MSKIDDLVRVYCDAFYAQRDKAPAEGITQADRAGIAAVVRALRDEFGRIMYPGDDWNRQGILEQFDQILGAAGDEVAGGSTREDGRATDAGFDSLPADVGPSTPATDICEWEKLRNSFGFKVSCSTKWLMNENYGGDMCPLCDKRIEYKFEPATDPAPAPCLWRVHHETRNGPLYVSQCDGEWRHATADPKCPACKKEIFFVTDPAPAARSDATAVCEWRVVHSSFGQSFFASGCFKQHDNIFGGICPSCGKPIKFTEAQR